MYFTFERCEHNFCQCKLNSSAHFFTIECALDLSRTHTHLHQLIRILQPLFHQSSIVTKAFAQYASMLWRMVHSIDDLAYATPCSRSRHYRRSCFHDSPSIRSVGIGRTGRWRPSRSGYMSHRRLRPLRYFSLRGDLFLDSRLLIRIGWDSDLALDLFTRRPASMHEIESQGIGQLRRIRW